jgi:hypothetical protein
MRDSIDFYPTIPEAPAIQGVNLTALPEIANPIPTDWIRDEMISGRSSVKF